jgi:hypothetical protein
VITFGLYAPTGSRRPVRTDLKAADSTWRAFLLLLSGVVSCDAVAFQGDAAFGARALPKIWQPTAVRTFFQGPEEYCS